MNLLFSMWRITQFTFGINPYSIQTFNEKERLIGHSLTWQDMTLTTMFL